MKVSSFHLEAYVDGELSPQERVTVEQAISACPDLARRVSELRSIKQLLTLAYHRVASQQNRS
jgi:anti-sigma factor RsiW